MNIKNFMHSATEDLIGKEIRRWSPDGRYSPISMEEHFGSKLAEFRDLMRNGWTPLAVTAEFHDWKSGIVSYKKSQAILTGHAHNIILPILQKGADKGQKLRIKGQFHPCIEFDRASPSFLGILLLDHATCKALHTSQQTANSLNLVQSSFSGCFREAAVYRIEGLITSDHDLQSWLCSCLAYSANLPSFLDWEQDLWHKFSASS